MSIVPIFGQSPKPRLIDSLHITPEFILAHNKMRATEVFYEKKAQLGAFYSILFVDLLEEIAKKLTAQERKQAFIVCEGDNGLVSVASFAEMDIEPSKLPGILLVRHFQDAGTKKFEIYGSRKDVGDIDETALAVQANKMIRLRYFLNDTKISADEQIRLQKSEMIALFPRDRTSGRWISGIKKIYLWTF